MTEKELQNYLKEHFPQENEKCEWKEFKSLKHSISAKDGEDVISYISAIANMNGGCLVIGIEDMTLSIIGIKDTHTYDTSNIKLKILTDCSNLSSEGFHVQEFITTDTNKRVWIFHIPKHPYRLPVYAHKKMWQRIEDSLVEMTPARLSSILEEVRVTEDWTAVIIPDANIDDIDPVAIEKARFVFLKRNPKYSDELKNWTNAKFLDKAKLTIKGKITRSCLILLGKEESEHFLGSFVKIRWNLKTINNEDKDFEIFSMY
ncbi:MAG: putative DNA binding domain-containing protein [Sphingobacteriales bacterium]|nr:putative DNA binding domain-containing protein [Sphingobacteriales bacterium]